MTSPPGWYFDPSGRHEFRYWDGRRWTPSVSSGGRTFFDDFEVAEPHGPSKMQRALEAAGFGLHRGVVGVKEAAQQAAHRVSKTAHSASSEHAISPPVRPTNTNRDPGRRANLIAIAVAVAAVALVGFLAMLAAFGAIVGLDDATDEEAVLPAQVPAQTAPQTATTQGRVSAEDLNLSALLADLRATVDEPAMIESVRVVAGDHLIVSTRYGRHDDELNQGAGMMICWDAQRLDGVGSVEILAQTGGLLARTQGTECRPGSS